MRRILVLNPNTSPDMTATIASALSGYGSTLSIDVQNVPWGPISVESEADNIVAASAVIDTLWSTRGQYDGYVIACFDDPGLAASRELVAQPVVGIGESAIVAARERADRVGVIVVDDRVVPRVAEHCARNGLTEERLVFGSLGGTVLEFNSTSAGVTERFDHVADNLIARGAQGIVLACAGFSDHAGRLERRTGIPVFDGNLCGVERVRALIESGQHNTTGVPPQPFTGERTPAPSWSAGIAADLKEDER